MALEALKARYADLVFDVSAVKTSGDRVLDRPLADFGGRGVFVKELEESLLLNEVDLVVHSLKDLPTEVPPGLILSGVLKRDDPRDVLVSRGNVKLAELPAGSRVATSSRRRSAQLSRQRQDLKFVDIRGNIQTRLRKLDEGECDAMILAAAGLLRLGLSDRIAEFFSVEVCTPAAGQGALALECRADDQWVLDLCRSVTDSVVLAEITAERAFLSRLGGGCSVPAGALARAGERLEMQACIVAIDGSKFFSRSQSGALVDAAAIGNALADSLLEAGAGEIIEELKLVPTSVWPP